MAKAFYLDEDEFYYEIVLSKGKGVLTKKAEIMLIKIANNFIKRKSDHYKTDDDKNDCVQTGLLFMFQNWNNFNNKKYKTAMPYFSEIFKRGIAQGYNELRNKKSSQDAVIMISLDSCNDGDGFFNI